MFLPSLFLAIFLKFHFPTTFFSSSSSWLLYFIPLPCKYLSSLFLTTCCPSQYLPVSFIPIPGHVLSSLYLPPAFIPIPGHLLSSLFLATCFHPYSVSPFFIAIPGYLLSSVYLELSFIPIHCHLLSAVFLPPTSIPLPDTFFHPYS